MRKIFAEQWFKPRHLGEKRKRYLCAMQHSTVTSILASHPAALGSILGVLQFFQFKEKIDGAEIKQQRTAWRVDSAKLNSWSNPSSTS